MSYSMSDLLQLVVSEGASDLHIRVGTPPTIRVHGILHRVEGPVLASEDTEELMRSITSEDHIQHVRERGGADFGFAFGEMARFRVSVFKEKGNFGVVLRQIPSKLLTMEQIGIPPSAKELLYKPRGLVLVTGPTGSGKSTTLAAMLDKINRERKGHIITIEDPIEFVHESKRSLINQRELHRDTHGFSEALRSALREDPDVILVGEMAQQSPCQRGIRHPASAPQSPNDRAEIHPRVPSSRGRLADVRAVESDADHADKRPLVSRRCSRARAQARTSRRRRP